VSEDIPFFEESPKNLSPWSCGSTFFDRKWYHNVDKKSVRFAITKNNRAERMMLLKAFFAVYEQSQHT
jgi:hypothetical protein